MIMGPRNLRKRVDEAMDRMREENYVLTCRLMQHAVLAGLIAILTVYTKLVVGKASKTRHHL